ncbi:MAG TPA: OsmC family protein [Longimicrobium sp.]|jgi:putative redox protein
MLGTEVVTRTAGDGYRTEITAGDHSLIVDEPVALGGSGAGPTPYDLLLAALGACTGMTLRMYAVRKEWPLEAVTVWLREGRDHAADCEQYEQPAAKLTVLDREIMLSGPLDEAQRARLAQIAELCPVHKSLAGAFHVRTTFIAPLAMDSIERARALVGDMKVDRDEDLGDDVDID